MKNTFRSSFILSPLLAFRGRLRSIIEDLPFFTYCRLKLSHMKIRDKLLFGFGFYIVIAVICGFIAYKDLRKITMRLNLVEVADDITNTILEVRRYEKNYLLFKDGQSLQEFRKYLDTLKKYIYNIHREIVEEIGTENFAMMKKSISSYEKIFDRIRMNLEAQEELVELLRTAGRTIEQDLTGSTLQTFLVLRRHEKNLMLYKDEATLGTFMQTYRQMGRNGDVENYVILVNKLYDLYQEELGSLDELRLKAREIQSFTENLSKREREEIGRILRASVNMVIFALSVIIIIGAVINVRLATSIATPIRRLEKITKKVAQGDFSEAIEVKGEDEIASLEISFNQMEERLRDAMTSLEKTVEKLQEKQAQLVEVEKLASIGKLAAGIAHEINNPLTSVLTFSSLMLEQMPEDDPRRERLKMIVRETTRAKNIVRQVLSFAKEAPLRTFRMNVNRPVGEIIDSLIAQEAFKDIELTIDLSENLPEIQIDPVQIGQVVLNILLNAIHAITPPGKISVATRASVDLVEIIFTDTGKGIPEDHLKKIFDPFFTTKDESKGTGLGLAVSYGIIKKHAGEIEVKSAVGKGTTFTVRLPINN